MTRAPSDRPPPRVSWVSCVSQCFVFKGNTPERTRRGESELRLYTGRFFSATGQAPFFIELRRQHAAPGHLEGLHHEQRVADRAAELPLVTIYLFSMSAQPPGPPGPQSLVLYSSRQERNPHAVVLRGYARLVLVAMDWLYLWCSAVKLKLSPLKLQSLNFNHFFVKESHTN